MISLGMVTLDTTDARAIAAWWATRLDGVLVDDADGWFCKVYLADSGIAPGFQKVDAPTPGKNRLHLDFERSADISRDELITEWVSAGATHLGEQGDPSFSWDVFADPDGNAFCISPAHN